MNVLEQYCKILNLVPKADDSREVIVASIKAALEERGDFSHFDEMLLTHDEVADDSLPARWLAGGRKPIVVTMSMTIKRQTQTLFLANLVDDKGGSKQRFTSLLAEEKTGVQIATTLRDEGYSFNEVVRTAEQLGFVLENQMEGEGIPNHMYPLIFISNQPRSKAVWQFWKEETADLTIEGVRWILPLEKVKELNLRVMPITLTQIEVEAEQSFSPEENSEFPPS